MRKILTSAVLAMALAGTSLGTANAAVHIGFNLGNVGVGYSDGYWDRGHHWHHWAHRGDLMRFRTAHADMYHEWRHDDRHHG